MIQCLGNHTDSINLTKTLQEKHIGFILLKSSIKQGNLIKKVKTYTLYSYGKLLQSCLIAKKTFRLYNISNKHKRELFKTFKADISRKRNNLISFIPMKTIFKFLIGIDLSKLRAKKNKCDLFNYLLNSSLGDIVRLIQNSQKPFDFNLEQRYSSKISYNDFKLYIGFMKEVHYSYKRKKNENDNYLKKFYDCTKLISTEQIMLINAFNLFINSFIGFEGL